MSSSWLSRDVIAAIISRFAYVWVKLCRKHWPFFIVPSKQFWKIHLNEGGKPVMSSSWLSRDVIAAIISQFGYVWVKLCRKHWPFFIVPSKQFWKIHLNEGGKPVMSSSWLSRDVNAETISQFGYVWVKFRPKYWEFMIKNEVILGLYKIKKTNRLCLIDYLNSI